MILKYIKQIVVVTLFLSVSLSGVHTIYISGPPVKKNKQWLKESKILYNAIKEEIIKSGDEIELFPKKKFRESIVRDQDITVSKKFLSKKEIESEFDDMDKLLDSLVLLIFKRHKELRDELVGLDNKIHLMAHGRGGELLLKLKDSAYKGLIKSYVVFNGDEDLYYSFESDSFLEDLSSVESDYESSSTEKDDILTLAIKTNGNLIVNFALGDFLSEKKSNKGNKIALVTGIVGLIGTIIALL